MKVLPQAAIVMAAFMLCSCVALTRGVHQGSFVSTGQPALTVSVPSLQLITSGNIMPQVTTQSALGGIPISTDLAVYGSRKPNSPMAVVALAQAPGGWFWDSDTTAMFSLSKGFAVIGGIEMQTSTYIIKGSGDAFATLSNAEKPDETLWLARRLAARMEIDRMKLTLEYREPLPAGIPLNVSRLGELSFEEVDNLRAFEKRAEEAFTVLRERSVDKLPLEYPQGIRTRYLNNNFLGTLSSYSPLDK